MTGVFDLDWRRMVALDDILSVTERATKRDHEEWFFIRRRSNEEPLDLSSYARDKLMMRPIQLIQAEPATFVVNAGIEDGAQWINRTPVVAWAMCFDGEVRPVTPQGVHDARGIDANVYVLMPNGSVQSVGEFVEPIWFDTLDEFVQHAAAPKPTGDGELPA